MTKYAAIEADFATWRPVQGRKVLQLVFEVPIEKTQHVLDTLGIPQPGDSKWCAIALLNRELVQGGASTPLPITNGEREALGSASTSQAAQAAALPKPFSSLPLSQQAAIRSNDPSFWSFLGAEYQKSSLGEPDATASLKDILAINSRRELDTDHSAGLRWRHLHGEYEAWLTDQKYAGSKR